MKYALTLFSILISITSFSQLKGTISDYSHFEIKLKKDTIDFVIADTSLSETKPVLLFCQGSQPIPLFIDAGEKGIRPLALSNFDLNKMKEQYHVVVISMPKTPIAPSFDKVNRSYSYVLDSSDERSYDPAFHEADYMENYVKRANRVIKFLLKQKWVDQSELVIAGHSQGSRIAVGIAHSNKKVTKLGLFGYNPMRRVDQLIWKYRKLAVRGEITWEEADSLQQNIYEFYKQILNDDILEEKPSLKSWRSFSVSSITQLSNLEIPVYIAFGSRDGVAEYCDVLPLHFAEEGKTNYVIKRYPNLEHNFFPLDKNLQPDYANGKWAEVMNSFIEWSNDE
ncbi:MAG: alpha/beta hydrolase [Crocinitomicaceae bacterium]